MDDHVAKPVRLDALAQALAPFIGSTAPTQTATATVADGDGAAVLDPAVLEPLRLLAGDGESNLLRELQTLYLRDTPPLLDALQAGVEAGDAEAVAFVAHVLKGSAANLGATRLTAVCQQIEDKARAGDLNGVDALVADAQRDARDVDIELDRVVAET